MCSMRAMERLLTQAREASTLRPQWLQSHALLVVSGLEALEELVSHLLLLSRNPAVSLRNNLLLLPTLEELQARVGEVSRLLATCAIGRSKLHLTLFGAATTSDFIGASASLRDCCRELVGVLRTSESLAPFLDSGLTVMFEKLTSSFDPSQVAALPVSKPPLQEEAREFLRSGRLFSSRAGTGVSLQELATCFKELLGQIGVDDIMTEVVLFQQHYLVASTHSRLDLSSQLQQGAPSTSAKRQGELLLLARALALLKYLADPRKLSDGETTLLSGWRKAMSGETAQLGTGSMIQNCTDGRPPATSAISSTKSRAMDQQESPVSSREKWVPHFVKGLMPRERLSSKKGAGKFGACSQGKGEASWLPAVPRCQSDIPLGTSENLRPTIPRTGSSDGLYLGDGSICLDEGLMRAQGGALLLQGGTGASVGASLRASTASPRAVVGMVAGCGQVSDTTVGDAQDIGRPATLESQRQDSRRSSPKSCLWSQELRTGTDGATVSRPDVPELAEFEMKGASESARGSLQTPGADMSFLVQQRQTPLAPIPEASASHCTGETDDTGSTTEPQVFPAGLGLSLPPAVAMPQILQPVIPSEYKCPLSHSLMVDPVIIASGHSFERAFIACWFEAGRHVCPASEEPLSDLSLIPNITLRSAIATWSKANGVPLPSEAPAPRRLKPGARRALIPSVQPLQQGSSHLNSGVQGPPRVRPVHLVPVPVSPGHRRSSSSPPPTREELAQPCSPLAAWTHGTLQNSSTASPRGNGIRSSSLRIAGRGSPKANAASVKCVTGTRSLGPGLSLGLDSPPDSSRRASSGALHKLPAPSPMARRCPSLPPRVRGQYGSPRSGCHAPGLTTSPTPSVPMTRARSDELRSRPHAWSPELGMMASVPEVPPLELDGGPACAEKLTSLLAGQANRVSVSTSCDSRGSSGFNSKAEGEKSLEPGPQSRGKRQEEMTAQQAPASDAGAHSPDTVLDRAVLGDSPAGSGNPDAGALSDSTAESTVALGASPSTSSDSDQEQDSSASSSAPETRLSGTEMPSGEGTKGSCGLLQLEERSLSQAPETDSSTAEGRGSYGARVQEACAAQVVASEQVPCAPTGAGPAQRGEEQRQSLEQVESSDSVMQDEWEESALALRNAPRCSSERAPSSLARIQRANSVLSNSPGGPAWDASGRTRLQHATTETGQGAPWRAPGAPSPNQVDSRPSSAGSRVREFPWQRPRRSDSWHPGRDLHSLQFLVWALRSPSPEDRLRAAQDIRKMVKTDDALRRRLAEADALRPLLDILREADDSALLEAALYALLNLSINDDLKQELAGLGAVRSILDLSTDPAMQVREGATALLFSLSADDACKRLIGQLGGVPFLVQMLLGGSDMARQDALLALYNLSLMSENKAALLHHRVLHPLVRLVNFAPGHRFSDNAISLIRNLVTREQGREALVDALGIPALAKALEWGSTRGKEEAAAVLLTLCQRCPSHRLMVQECNILPALRTLARCGAERGRNKAELLLQELQGK